MDKKIENKILNFTRLTGLTERHEIVHGTLYVTLLQPERCDFFHDIIRTFYKDNINPEGGVNMFSVGDEFCFDFVEADRETGVWSEFAEEELMNNIPEDVDTMLGLEADAQEGR